MNRKGKRVTKIVLTGGPCAGKTTGLSWIQNTFEKMGYTLIFMQEPATELKSAGITPARCSSMMAYQLFQMKLQLEKEDVYTRAALDIADPDRQETEKKVLIVCDRGFFVWVSRRTKNCAATMRFFIWRRRPRMLSSTTGPRPMPSGMRHRNRRLPWMTV